MELKLNCKYELNESGLKLREKWLNIYEAQLDIIRDAIHDKEFFEGWFIIDTAHIVRTIEDECGLMLQGYDEEAISIVDEWKENGVETSRTGLPVDEFKKELLKYYKITIKMEMDLSDEKSR